MQPRADAPLDVLDRFLKSVDGKEETGLGTREDECEIWIGRVQMRSNGAPAFPAFWTRDRGTQSAVRLAHEWYVGPLTRDTTVRHTCAADSHGFCVNPRHMRAEPRQKAEKEDWEWRKERRIADARRPVPQFREAHTEDPYSLMPVAAVVLTADQTTFLKHVSGGMVGGGNACNFWTGTSVRPVRTKKQRDAYAHRTNRRYGICRVGGKREYAHRAAYRWFVGPIPVGRRVKHVCEKASLGLCVNPRHLYVSGRPAPPPPGSDNPALLRR
jgi:hypothetical protein